MLLRVPAWRHGKMYSKNPIIHPVPLLSWKLLESCFIQARHPNKHTQIHTDVHMHIFIHKFTKTCINMHTQSCRLTLTQTHLHSSCHHQISGNQWYMSIHRSLGCSRRSGHKDGLDSANTRLHLGGRSSSIIPQWNILCLCVCTHVCRCTCASERVCFCCPEQLRTCACLCMCVCVCTCQRDWGARGPSVCW